MDDKDLSSPMCWDAVKKCDAKVVAVHRNVNAQHGLVSFADEFVRTREDVKKLMPGYGWESHNLSELRWENGGLRVPAGGPNGGPRTLQIRARLLGADLPRG